MGSVEQTNIINSSPQGIKQVDRLALYDRYGSLAYGIILSIIPEPELAQTVLINVFASPRLASDAKTPTATDIIRLARAEALANRPSRVSQSMLPKPDRTDTTETSKLVFDLSFCQGYSIEAIAEKLHLSPTNVLKVFYTYFKQLRSS